MRGFHRSVGDLVQLALPSSMLPGAPRSTARRRVPTTAERPQRQARDRRARCRRCAGALHDQRIALELGQCSHDVLNILYAVKEAAEPGIDRLVEPMTNPQPRNPAEAIIAVLGISVRAGSARRRSPNALVSRQGPVKGPWREVQRRRAVLVPLTRTPTR